MGSLTTGIPAKVKQIEPVKTVPATTATNVPIGKMWNNGTMPLITQVEVIRDRLTSYYVNRADQWIRSQLRVNDIRFPWILNQGDTEYLRESFIEICNSIIAEIKARPVSSEVALPMTALSPDRLLRLREWLKNEMADEVSAETTNDILPLGIGDYRVRIEAEFKVIRDSMLVSLKAILPSNP